MLSRPIWNMLTSPTKTLDSQLRHESCKSDRKLVRLANIPRSWQSRQTAKTSKSTRQRKNMPDKPGKSPAARTFLRTHSRNNSDQILAKAWHDFRALIFLLLFSRKKKHL